MRFFRKRAALVLPVVVLSLAAAACSGGAGDADGDDGRAGGDPVATQGGVFRMGIVEPVAIDPYNAQDSEGILVTKLLFDGLTDATPDGEVVKAVATKIEKNDDCSQWTFTLKSGTTFSNGDPVNAQAFIRGWTRAATQEAASDVAYHMAGIEGFDALQNGTADTFAGLSAPEEYVLVVDLAQPDCLFHYKTTHPVFSPAPDGAGPASNATYNAMPIGNGPFTMAEPWQHNRSITLVRNDTYYGDKANIDRVDISILNADNDISLEYQGFAAGEFDWARIPDTQLAAARAKYKPQGDWIAEDINGMSFVMPVTDKPPMESRAARLAVSYAIDRAAIIEGVFKGFQTKATTIVPPVFTTFYQRGLCSSCQQQDPDKARSLAAQAGLPPGSTVGFVYGAGVDDGWAQAVIAQLETVLGWKIDARGMPFKEFLATTSSADAAGLFRLSWSADYPTPDNYLFPLLHSEAINATADGEVRGDNRGRYSNPEFDALVTQARGTEDPAKRRELYQQAERVALEDMALIPLWNSSKYVLYDSSKWQNVELTFSANPNLAELSLR